jgi:MFS family permease
MEATTHSFKETFSPLRNRNVSTYLAGQSVSLFGTFMQATAQSWVVWQLSHSTRDLGLVAMLGSLPLLVFGAFAGVWADRLNRRKVLLGTQIISMLLAFIFAILLQTSLIQTWHVFVLSFLLGCVNALDMPAQTAFVGDLSGIEQLRRAIVLNSMVVQVSRMVGPALAGWAIASLSTAAVFWINGASFIAVIGSLLLVRSQQARKPATEKKTGEMGEAFQFAAHHPRMVDLLVMCLLVTFLVFSSAQLIPAIVTDTLHAGPETLGLLMGATGAGALASAIFLVPLVQRARRPGLVIAAALAWTGVWFTLAVVIKAEWLWVIGMFLGSLSSPVVMTSSNALIQLMSPPTMKARLISLWIITSFGMQPFGFLLVGYTGQLLGAPGAILLNGLLLIFGAIAMLVFRPGLRNWQPVAFEHTAPAGNPALANQPVGD